MEKPVLLLLLLLSGIYSCHSPTSSCIDPAKIDASVICTMQYEPVCGCDNKTYSNACVAGRSGVTSFTRGACP